MNSLKVCCGIFWNDIAALPVLTVNIEMHLLNVGKSTVSDRLHAMGKIQKEGK